MYVYVWLCIQTQINRRTNNINADKRDSYIIYKDRYSKIYGLNIEIDKEKKAINRQRKEEKKGEKILHSAYTIQILLTSLSKIDEITIFISPQPLHYDIITPYPMMTLNPSI